MAELDVALRELGREIEFPPTPDIASAVRGRLERPRRWRRPVAIALAVLAVAVGAVLAVPPARTAVLDWLGLSSVRIVRVDELPPTPAVERLELGRQVSLEQAPLWLLVPDDEPDSDLCRRMVRVSLLWGTPDRRPAPAHRVPGRGLHREAGRPGAERRARDGQREAGRLARGAARRVLRRPPRARPAGARDASRARRSSGSTAW